MKVNRLLISFTWLAFAGLVAPGCTSDDPEDDPTDEEPPNGDDDDDQNGDDDDDDDDDDQDDAQFSIARGVVTDQGLDEDAVRPRAESVVAYAYTGDRWRRIGSATVQRDGSYTLRMTKKTKGPLILEAVSEQKDRLSAVILSHPAQRGQSVAVAPMDRETSIEALMLRNLAHVYGARGLDLLHLRTVVSPELAHAAARGLQGGGVVKGGALPRTDGLQPLIGAYIAGHAARHAALESHDFELDYRDLYTMHQDTARRYDLALGSRGDREDAEQQLRVDLTEGWGSLGIGPLTTLRMEQHSSIGMRLALDAFTDSDFGPARDTLHALQRSMADLEATRSVASLLFSVEPLPQSDAFASRIAQLGEDLRLDLQEARDLMSLIDGWNDFEVQIAGTPRDLKGSLLADAVPPSMHLIAVHAANGARLAASALDLELAERGAFWLADASPRLSPKIAMDLADDIVSAWTQYELRLDQAVEPLHLDPLSHSLALQVGTDVIGSFRGSYEGERVQNPQPTSSR